MPSSFDKQDTRLLIVAAAAHEAALGAHYINGADGGITERIARARAGGWSKRQAQDSSPRRS